jgi:cytochrome b
MSSPTAPDYLKVWDLLVRTVHWTVVTAVAVAWIVTSGGLHDIAGYIVLVLMLVRVVWGFIGPKHARFTDFVRSPREVRLYMKALLSSQEPRYVGHNPLGGWMTLALLGAGLTTAASGWLYTTDAFWGVAWVEAVHVLFAYLMLALVIVHVAGVLFTSFRQRENLVAAMLHGRKRAP